MKRNRTVAFMCNLINKGHKLSVTPETGKFRYPNTNQQPNKT